MDEKPVRKSLQTITHMNMETGNLATKKNIKDYFRSRDIENRQKSKSTQANLEPLGVVDIDLSTSTPSDKYWQVVAEKRRVALEEALTENEMLHNLSESLSKENEQYKQMLEEAESFITVFKDLVKSDADDTGIDCGDVGQNGED